MRVERRLAGSEERRDGIGTGTDGTESGLLSLNVKQTVVSVKTPNLYMGWI